MRAALYVAHAGTARSGTVPNIKLSITHSFFAVQTPDFAWKFVWIVRKNYKSTKVQKSTKVLITQQFFELQTPDFA